MRGIFKKFVPVLLLPIIAAAQGVQPADPFEAMLQMQREMDAVMARFHEQMMRDSAFGDFMSTRSTLPKTDLKEKGGKYILSMEIPGADRKSIDVHAKDRMVSVEASREELHDENSTTYYRHERSVSRYSRTVMVPEDADTGNMEVDYKNGILTVTMPKKTKR